MKKRQSDSRNFLKLRRKKYIRGMFLVLIFVLPLSSAPREPATPAHILQLYLEVMVNAREESKESLNAYLQPLYSKGTKAFPKPLSIFNTLVEDSHKFFISRLPRPVAAKVSQEARLYYEDLFSLVRSADCKSSDGEVQGSGDNSFWLMTYNCSFRMPQKSSLLQRDVSRLSASQLTKLLQSARKDIARSSKHRNVSGQFPLYPVKKIGSLYYINPTPQQLTMELVDKFLTILEEP